MTISIAAALDAAIKAVCPILGVSIGRPDDKATWRIDFADTATVEERAAALAVVEAFDPASVVEPRKLSFELVWERLSTDPEGPHGDEFAKVRTLESGSSQFMAWVRRAMTQGYVNLNSPEFAQARLAVIASGEFTAERFDEVFATEEGT